jgi:hypothetical protein
MNSRRRDIRITLSEKEYEGVKRIAQENNLKTKTFTEFLIRRILMKSADSDLIKKIQIGRASCRERVYSYV